MSLLSKIIKKNAKGALRLGSKLVGGVPIVGGLASSALAKAGSRGTGTAVTPYNPPGIQLPGGLSIDFPGFGRPGYGIMATGARRGRVAPGPNGECPKGYHLNKSATADGAAARSFCTRNRRVNFANGRAARRAGRRLRGTVRVLRKSFTLVSAKAPKGKWVPKGRGKR